MKVILQELKKMNEKIERIDRHIHFIEGVYESVKHPLGFICNKINTITGNSIKEGP